MKKRDIYRSIVEQVPDGIYVISKGRFDYANRAFEEMTGIGRNSLPAPAFDFLSKIHPADRAVLRKRRETARLGGSPRARFRIRTKSADGSTRYLELNTAPVSGLEDTVLGIVRDVTEARMKESARRRQERRFRAVIEAAHDPIAVIQDGVIVYANPALSDLSGIPRDAITGKPVGAFIAPEKLASIEEAGRLHTPGGSAPFFYETIGVNGGGERVNIQVSVAPVVFQGKPSFLAVCQDITRFVRAEADLSRALTEMRGVLGATVQAITEILEQRDPYTAGHQRRVADLGAAIASILDYPAERIEGIRIAGLLHDLGKISIPAEILTKPKKLTDAEFDLIKTHPRTAYDILKKITFPWPVADIVHQHHERMDGSGYPLGLKGPEILAEARILAVADVVEAMITHRPYRAASRLEEALDEIGRNRATLFDGEAVDGCVKAFRSGAFEFRAGG